MESHLKKFEVSHTSYVKQLSGATPRTLYTEVTYLGLLKVILCKGMFVINIIFVTIF